MALLIAVAPMVPLMVSDLSGLDRGWLWYSWSAIAIAWALTILAGMLYQTGKTAVGYYRNWWSRRRR